MDTLNRPLPEADVPATDAVAVRGEARDVEEAATYNSMMHAQLDRRRVLQAAAAVPAVAVSGSMAAGVIAGAPEPAFAQATSGNLTFTSVPATNADTVTVPAGYEAQIVIRWGDPLVPGLRPFDINNQNPADARQRCGFEHDMIAIFPERFGAPATVGRFPYPSYIVAINHENVTPELLFPGFVRSAPTRNQVDTMLEYLGVSIFQIRLVNGSWVYDPASRFNRRITLTTPIEITGPAAGHPLLRTPADPTGTRVLGTFNNCAGGFTPWGTYLSAEENIQAAFANRGPLATSNPNRNLDHTDFGPIETGRVSTFGPGSVSSQFIPRFDVATPEGINEPFRFGWVVEVDPYNPNDVPKKRTALGRFLHECATVVLGRNDEIVVYQGNDAGFEHVFKFIASRPFDRTSREANFDRLDRGTLYAARFNEDGTGAWLPLDFNNPAFQAALQAANGRAWNVNGRTVGPSNQYPDGTLRITNQAEVLIHAQRAGDLVGATPMDRPEDVEAPTDPNDPFRGTGRCYVVMTENSRGTRSTAANAEASRSSTPNRQTSANPNASNPKAPNQPGHIVEIFEANDDNASLTFTWRVFILCGDPANPAVIDPTPPANNPNATNNTSVANPFAGGAITMVGDRFSRPDNIVFDRFQNIYISTDGNAGVFADANDVVVVAPTDVPVGQPVVVKRFLVGPRGAEICGPLLTPDQTTFFCNIQHPGEGGTITGPGQTSAFPDGEYPRPAMVAVRRLDRGRIGS